MKYVLSFVHFHEINLLNQFLMIHFSHIQVDTVKRLVIRKLPKIMAIQLKRFDYDWERFVHLQSDNNNDNNYMYMYRHIRFAEL